MRVIIVGAGEVGSNIAASLADSHDVVVVDVDPETVEELTYSSDVLAIEGDGASLSVLRDAGIGEADMLIASTDNDETNLAVCGTAKTTGDVFTIARVRDANFLDTWQQSAGAFGVDFMVSTNLLTAQDIVRVVGLPAAVDVDPFVGGLVQMAEFEVTEESEIAGQTVEDADKFEALTFAALVRNGDVAIARGQTVIEAGDKAIVIGTPESVQAFSRTVAPVATPDEARDIVIIGGSDIGYHTAKLLEEREIGARLIERDPERGRELAESLPGTLVMEHDGTDVEFLTGEQVDRADAVIAAMGSDEKNLLVALLAKNIGVRRTVAVVEDGQYANLFETVGIDVAVNPREATAEEIVRFTQEGKIENLSLIEGRQAEVLEIEVDEGSVLTGRPIRESMAELPPAVVVGAITRGQSFVVPRGDTVIEPGDHVVLFVAADVLSTVMSAV
ncbi:Trk system potassium transporter TrkA [Haloarcula nitratireducens]|uniref:Trk system potassium transporter TrkA n=1 Tax=Haloarcula nitratireducens TaxID=2487749 RepID=A0AAW4PBC1_9EURY|nr:Trk system potassium transporter TrkA [Halomicroarcula nitratireducens]MBX0295179.1 Trk system potassium transporter TrkA [Halomicroarcula nitratireducens]